MSSQDTSRIPTGRRPPADPVPQHLVAEFGTYAEAEKLVDTLSDNGFPVQHVRILGTGLRTVEYVTGRLTTGRAALAGVGGGAWFGLLFGLLIGLFSTGSTWLAVLVGATAIGAAWGAIFGFLAQYALRGRRDFSSVKGLEAEHYAVYVDASYKDDADRLSTAHRSV